MKRTFGSFAVIILHPFRGVPFMVSCGCVHRQLPMHTQNHPVPCKEREKRDLRVPVGYCFKLHRGHMCSGSSKIHDCFKCHGAHLVLNCNVLHISPTPQVPKLPGPPPMASPQKLPTPVRVKILDYFLSRYDPLIVDFLVKGFRMDFQVHYKVNRQSFMSILFELCKILML